MKKVIEIQDKYNPQKVWIIKRTSCRHYYINQKVCGRIFCPHFQRVSKAFINDVLDNYFAS